MNCPHCDTHIDEHKATRCLRGWICRDVMGWEVINDKDGLPAHVITDKGDHMYLLPDLGPQWYPDIDISAAWEVVEKLLKKDVLARVRLDSGIVRQWIMWASNIDISTWASGETAPLAICRAAIKVNLNG